jgi:hypothetical protein
VKHGSHGGLTREENTGRNLFHETACYTIFSYKRNKEIMAELQTLPNKFYNINSGGPLKRKEVLCFVIMLQAN